MLVPWTLITLLIAVVLLGSCRRGDSDEQGGLVDMGRVPTQTLPTSPPDPIIVGGSPVRGTPTAAAAQETYQVQAGDSLGAIAARYGTTVDELVRLNNLTDPGSIQVGQVLRVPRAPGAATATPAATGPAGPGLPGGTPAGTPGGVTGPGTPVLGGTATATPPGAGGTPGVTRTPTVTGTAPSSVQTYEVRPGDTALAIAAQFGVTVEELATANGMTVAQLSNLQIGQQLRIPRR